MCVIDRDLSFKRFVDLDFGPGETEAFGLGRDLERAALPLHDVVVADAAFMHEAADAVEAFGSRTPGGFRFARCPGEAAVVIGDELLQYGVGCRQIASVGETKLAGEAVLQHAQRRSMRPLAWGLCAAMKVTPSCSRARPT